MRYIVTDAFTQLSQTSGTVQNVSRANVVELSTDTAKDGSVLLYPRSKFSFSNLTLYARCIGNGGAEIRVVPFFVDIGVVISGGASIPEDTQGGDTIGGDTPDIVFSDNSYHPSATSCTVFAAQYDLGVLNEHGADVYTNLISIKASQGNSTLYGNSNANTFIAAGGDGNVFHGGIGNDTYIFKTGGGIISDFGIGASNLGDGTELAAVPTEANRLDPLACEQGNDRLKVEGTVVEIAFKDLETSASGASQAKRVFRAYVTYDAADSSGTHTVMLANIAKQPINSGDSPVYKTDRVAAKMFKIFDMRDGSSLKVLSTAELDALFTSKSASNYAGNIAALDALFAATPFYTEHE